jgi:hypothetical protein
MSHHDPFQNDDPRWAPFQFEPSDKAFGGVVCRERELGDFLREQIKQQAERQLKPLPQAEPWRIGTIQGFP